MSDDVSYWVVLNVFVESYISLKTENAEKYAVMRLTEIIVPFCKILSLKTE